MDNAELLGEWRTHLAALYARSTVYAYLYDVRKFAEEEDIDLLQVTRSDIDTHLASERDRGVSVAAVRRRLSSLRMFYRWALDAGRIEGSPVEGIKWPTASRRLPRILSDEETTALLDVKLDLRTRVLVRLMLLGGLRRIEVIRAERGDISLADNVIRVTGKGDKERDIPLHSLLREALKAWLNGTVGKPSDPLFPGYKGESLKETVITSLIHEAGEAAGLSKKLTPHMLRHTFATRLMRAKVHLRVVQELLGHANVATTQIYTHVANEDLRDAISKL